ncbi:MAG: PPC domain-containing protein, partial [Acidobacteria bacterium]|nr:PPC domain-containing protein [Acidobacteriota bacterium]
MNRQPRFGHQSSLLLLLWVSGALSPSSFLVWNERIEVMASTEISFHKVQNNPASNQATAEPTLLSATDIIERELQAEQKHSFTVQLEANQFVRIEVEQQGIDVIVRLFDPAGKQVQEMDSPNGTKGPEHLRHVTVEAGKYRVEVGGLEKGAKPGKYTIRLGEVRPPQPDDAAVIHYDQLANRVKILLGVERFQEVLPIAEQLVTAAAEAY